MKVVIPIVAGIGNALMAVPMVRQLKRHHPEAHITVLARIDAMAEPFRRLSEVDETRVVSKPQQSIRAARAIRADVYIVPFPSNRWQYSLLQFASGGRRRLIHSYPVGQWQALHFLPAERVESVRGIHDVVQNLNLIRRLGIEPDEHEGPIFPLREEDEARADELLRGINGPFIAVHAGSARTILAQAKRWPSERYAELIARLDSQIVLLEGPDEAGVASEILNCLAPSPGTPGEGRGEGDFERRTIINPPNHPHPNPLPEYRERGPERKPHVLKLTGNLGTAGAVLSRAQMYVGSDSGLGHLAAAVGTPPVTIFAPADPDRVCPFGYRHLVVQPNEPRCDGPCSPCFLYPWDKPYPAMRCHEPMCVNSITVDAVLEKISLCRVFPNVS